MKRAALTGGQGGLAKAVASVLREAGWDVAAPGRSELDVRDPASVRRFFHRRPLELLVCNAGVIRDAPLARLKPEAWDEVWDTNFAGAARCAREAVAGMAAGGQIVFISSGSAFRPPVGQAAYGAAKAALLGLTRELARELGPADVRVNAILPGFLETPMTAAISTARRGQIRADHALGRFNTPQAVAGFLLHLHDHLPHTSGQVFQLDSR